MAELKCTALRHRMLAEVTAGPRHGYPFVYWPADWTGGARLGHVNKRLPAAEQRTLRWLVDSKLVDLRRLKGETSRTASRRLVVNDEGTKLLDHWNFRYGEVSG